MFTVFICIFFSATILVSFITYLLYWYEEGSRPYGAHPGVCTRAACIAKGLLMSFVSQCCVYATYPLALVNVARIPRKKIATVSLENPPVLFVHGLYHNASAWILFRYWFARHGLTHTYCFSYLSFNQHFAKICSKLDNQVEKLRAVSPDVKPVLVGHSLGGLVIRAWLAQGDNASKIQGVVSMGTPHQGSKLAGLGIGSLCRSIIFRGDLIRSIENADINPPVPCYSLSSALDNMVLPQEGLHIRTKGWCEERTQLVSHIAMLYHKSTAEHVIRTVHKIIAWKKGQPKYSEDSLRADMRSPTAKF